MSENLNLLMSEIYKVKSVAQFDAKFLAAERKLRNKAKQSDCS